MSGNYIRNIQKNNPQKNPWWRISEIQSFKVFRKIGIFQ